MCVGCTPTLEAAEYAAKRFDYTPSRTFEPKVSAHICKRYNALAHPDVLCGKLSAAAANAQLRDFFDVIEQDGTINLKEFTDFHSVYVVVLCFVGAWQCNPLPLLSRVLLCTARTRRVESWSARRHWPLHALCQVF